MIELTAQSFVLAALGLALGLLIGWLVARRRTHEAEVRLATAEASLRSAADVAAERDQALDMAMQRLRSGFDTVAGQALRGNNEVFLQLARQTLGQQQEVSLRNLTEREKAVESLLAPVREALQKTHEQIARIEKERAESFGALRSSIESVALGQVTLQRETRNLVTALRRPEVRGQWGEMTLRRLAELAGMVERCDFFEQVHVPGEDGSLRPDMIVNMPDGRQIVVDVKTPLDAYLTAAEATTDEDRDLALRRHAMAVQERVRQLSQKAYWSQFEQSPDFVVLFIPGDQFLSAAVAEVPSLLEDAIRQHVIIATPTSFVALLKAVAYGWRQNALAENAQRIQELGEDMYKRLVTFTTHISKVGRTLGQSVEAYNAAVGSLERQVLPGARKFTELGLRPAKEIEELAPIDKLARAVIADAPAEARTDRGPGRDDGAMTDDPLQRGTPPGSLRYFAVLYAPERARPLLGALYAFEAEIRDTVRATSHDVSHTRLQWWRGEVDRLVAGRPEHPVTRALLPLREAGADVSLLHEVMVAADIDLARIALGNADEVAALAFRSAGSIQSLAAAASSQPRKVSTAELEFARRLGDTIAGVESLRDLRAEALAGRLRLPLDQLERAGVDPARLLDEPAPTGLAGVLQHEHERLHRQFDALETLLSRDERIAQRQGLVLAALHRRLLERIDTTRGITRYRVEVSPWSKFWLAWRTAVRYA